MARARPAPAPSPVHQQPQPAAALNPYATPAAAYHPGPATDEPGYPGFGRLEYFLWHIGLGAVSYVLLVLVGTNMGGSAHFDEAVWGPMILTIVLGTGVGSLYLGVQRVRNLGMSGWAILWHFVPFVILWISWRMFACPPGYDDHRQLDFAGKILTGLVAGTFVLAILASFMAA
jgi:uncharacterized membrane protein YhaH (DUF805 family)